MLIPSRIQDLLSYLSRYILVKRFKASIGNAVRIHFSVKVISPKNLRLGKNSFIGQGCYFDASDYITIGENTLIAPNVFIATRNHQFDDRIRPIKKQGYVYRPVIIGNDCWVGFGAKIMPGVVLGDGCVVAAGSVVTKSIAEYSIVAGVPAKIIGERNEKAF